MARTDVLNPGYQEHLGRYCKTQTPTPIPTSMGRDSPEAGRCCRVPKGGQVRAKGRVEKPRPYSAEGKAVCMKLLSSICAAIMENSVEFPEKTKTRLNI